MVIGGITPRRILASASRPKQDDYRHSLSLVCAQEEFELHQVLGNYSLNFKFILKLEHVLFMLVKKTTFRSFLLVYFHCFYTRVVVTLDKGRWK